MAHSRPSGLSLAPFRALRPTADPERLGRLLCPPFDVIDDRTRERLLAGDPQNAVAVILPDATPAGYEQAGARLREWIDSGLFAVDDDPALFVYEMRTSDGAATRGLLGAVELRDPADRVILPHENTMAGPVADRLAVMTATGADLEAIYLVYDGGGAASDVVKNAESGDLVAQATTGDGATHRLWALRDPAEHRAVSDDLADRRALIADGHHRYATYLERQRRLRKASGTGPWDRGLALLVDSSEYGPQVHAIHRVVAGFALEAALSGLATDEQAASTDDALARALVEAERVDGFAAVLTDGESTVLVTDPSGRLRAAAARPGDPPALADLDVSVVHRGLIENVWGLRDTEEVVGYAHTVAEAVEAARARNGLAILMRPTPVAAVAGVAAAGARMPRKSTLFTPKPASGLVMRRLGDQPSEQPG